MLRRRANLLMWLATALLFAGAIAALAAGLLLPLDDPETHVADHHRTASRVSSSATAALPPLTAYESIWSRQLRQPETSASAPPMEAASAPANSDTSQQQQIALAGTIGNSLAIFRLSDGSTVLKAVGEEIGDAEVVSIQPARVRLREGNREIELSKPLTSSATTMPSAQ